MQLETVYAHLVQKPAAVEDYPFGEQALVMKVGGKMFALVAPDEIPPRLTLKCDPERALQLRARYAAVQPGYHMNKKHWNTISLDGSIDDEHILDLIDHSYALVVAKLSKKDRQGAGL